MVRNNFCFSGMTNNRIYIIFRSTSSTSMIVCSKYKIILTTIHLNTIHFSQTRVTIKVFLLTKCSFCITASLSTVMFCLLRFWDWLLFGLSVAWLHLVIKPTIIQFLLNIIHSCFPICVSVLHLTKMSPFGWMKDS